MFNKQLIWPALFLLALTSLCLSIWVYRPFINVCFFVTLLAEQSDVEDNKSVGVTATKNAADHPGVSERGGLKKLIENELFCFCWLWVRVKKEMFKFNLDVKCATAVLLDIKRRSPLSQLDPRFSDNSCNASDRRKTFLLSVDIFLHSSVACQGDFGVFCGTIWFLFK
jgi:hypothetical protein